MTNLCNDTPKGSSLTVRWKGEEFAKIQAAAQALSAREQILVTRTDIIRRGALREAEAILERAAA